MKDLVSIITPSYNSFPFIKQTIESVFSQTYENWEMIIVDDCSEDGSFETVQAYAEQDARIKIHSLSQNSGPAVARNKAIDMAEGRFIAFLDSDDLWVPEKLEKQIEWMTEKEYAFTYTHYSVIDEKGVAQNKVIRPPERLNYSDMLKSNRIGCLTAIYDTRQLGKVFMPDILKRQDYGLWLKLLKKVDFAYCLPEPLAYYRARTNSVSSQKFKLLKYNWHLFHNIERFYKVKASYYLMMNVMYKLINSNG